MVRRTGTSSVLNHSHPQYSNAELASWPMPIHHVMPWSPCFRKPRISSLAESL